MNEPTSATIAGGWLGTYYYDGALAWQEPARFEATFAMSFEGRGSFSGTILDDGPLGEADVTGTQAGRSVTFTKVYRAPSPGHLVAPVAYEGMLSEDGKLVTGTWTIHSQNRARRPQVHGTWEAHRIWAAETEEEPEVEARGQERELAGAVGVGR